MNGRRVQGERLTETVWLPAVLVYVQRFQSKSKAEDAINKHRFAMTP